MTTVKYRCVICGKPLNYDGSICQRCTNNVFSTKPRTSNKYGARRLKIDGITFDSKLEADRYQQLKLLEKAGQIKGLEYHKKFVIIPKSRYGENVLYEADFFYFENGKPIVEDTKSEATITAVYKLKKRLLAETHGITIKEVYRKDI